MGSLWANMLPVADLRSFFSGSWQVERSLHDRRRAVSGRFRGRARFTAVGDSLFYEELGMLDFGARIGPAEQHYRYDFDGGTGRASVRFRDGRAFHDLDLSHGQTLVTHACEPDFYRGEFIALDAIHWRASWEVTGPRKDQQISTVYIRQAPGRVR